MFTAGFYNLLALLSVRFVLVMQPSFVKTVAHCIKKGRKKEKKKKVGRVVSIRVPKIPPFFQLQAVNKPIKDEDASKTFRCRAIKSPVRRTRINPLYLQCHKSTEANLQDNF